MEIDVNGRTTTLGALLINTLLSGQEYYNQAPDSAKLTIQAALALSKGGPLGAVSSVVMDKAVSAVMEATGADKFSAEIAAAVGMIGLYYVLGDSPQSQVQAQGQDAAEYRGALLTQAAITILGTPALAKSIKGAASVAKETAQAAQKASLGNILGSYSTINPGPLADNLAGTFSGGRYKAVELAEDTVLYRAGTASQPLGQFFTTEIPSSVIKARIDSAVLPEWPGGAKSPLDTTFAVKIPKGTPVYVGEASSQGGFYVGGTQQIVVVQPATIPGVQVVNSVPLNE